jgi:hypothetical protein
LLREQHVILKNLQQIEARRHALRPLKEDYLARIIIRVTKNHSAKLSHQLACGKVGQLNRQIGARTIREADDRVCLGA